MDRLLPIFPLDLVLFPATPLPLHIFEPRYKEMIGECLAEQRPFGVVRARENALAEVGCTAEIVEVVKKHEDGRMDIVVEGRQRFQIVELNEERSFLRAEVAYLEDEPGSPTSEQRYNLLEVHKRLLALVGAQITGEDPDDPQLAYHLVAGLPLDLDFKQTLLGMRSEAERVKAVSEYYTALIPRMQRAAKARQKAGGNGHGV